MKPRRSDPAGLFFCRAPAHVAAVMRLPIVLFSSALLASCAPDGAPTPTPVSDSANRPESTGAAAPPAASPASSPAAAPATALVTSLAGEWRVAGIDGADFNEPVGLALSGNADELWWEPRCARFIRSYRISGTGIQFGPPAGAGPPPPPGTPPEPVCTIGLLPRLPQVMRALDAATTVVRTEQNGVLISGGGHSLLLFSQ